MVYISIKTEDDLDALVGNESEVAIWFNQGNGTYNSFWQ